MLRTVCILMTLALPAAAQETGERQEPRGPGASDLGATTEAFTVTDGETIYARACAGCHQPQGQGAYGAGAYPALGANPRLQDARYPTWIVLNGQGAMPAFNNWLDDEQIVEVVTYLQQNFGNAYDSHPTPDQVAELRSDLERSIPEPSEN